MDAGIVKLIQDYFGHGTFAAFVIGALFLGAKFIKPLTVQADANSTLFNQMQKRMERQELEIQLLKRQVILLEQIAIKNGVDVEAVYREKGIYDDQEKLNERPS